MICLVDLSGLFWRNYHGSGSDVDAYQLTLDQIEGYRKRYERTAVCCDCGPLLRSEWFPAYKEQRKPKPEDAIDSLRAIEQQAETWDTPLIKLRGYEADDVIATIVDQAWLDDVLIVSSDKDLFQLVSDSVKLMTKNGEVGPEECVKKFGVRPDQMLDYLTLTGDTSDNVPGCTGIGPGRARDLLAKFGSLDAIMAASDEELSSVRGMGEKTLASLRGWDPTLARRLITLLRDAPVSLEKLWNEAA